MPAGWSFIAELPPRNDCETTVEKRWELLLPQGVNFEGQKFRFLEGGFVEAYLQWLEPSLLSVRLSLSAQAVGECARCLAETSLAIRDDLMYLYYPRTLELGKDTRMDSDAGFMPVEVEFFGRTLDLSEQVWETLLLLLPQKVLCGADCLGLCPECGADLNQGPCGCSKDGKDPRLEILRSLPLGDSDGAD